MGKCNIDGFTCSFAHGFDNSFVKSLIKIGFIEVLLYPSSVLGRSPLESDASSICPDKIFFALDKSKIVQDKNFVQG